MNETVPYFDHAEVQIFEAEVLADQGAQAAWNNFLSLTVADRLADSHHVYAYYKDYHEAVGGEDWLDEEMGVPENPEAIWQYVTPGTVELRKDDDGIWYVMLEAECGWEVEHGLLLVWREGKVLIKTGSYDGHTTNAYAYDDELLTDVVYAATNPAYTTRLPQS